MIGKSKTKLVSTVSFRNFASSLENFHHMDSPSDFKITLLSTH